MFTFLTSNERIFVPKLQLNSDYWNRQRKRKLNRKNRIFREIWGKGPLHMSPVTGLARLPGRILRCVHMGNFSPVDRDEFKHNQNGAT